MDIRLLNQVLRGKWFIAFSTVTANAVIVEKLLNRDWDSWQTHDLNSEERDPIPVMIASEKQSASRGNSYDGAPQDSTGIIPLKGSMIKYGTLSTYGTEEIANEMLKAGEHKNISSIVLDIDSGGGAVDAVAPMVDAIRKVRNEFNKPVVANVDLCCSAAEWVASECNLTIANNTISAEIGSVGVMLSFLDVIPYFESLGAKYHEIYGEKSDEFKNKPFRMALEGKYDLIKEEELNPLEKNFQETIKKNRAGKLNTDVKGILYGRTFYADKALEYGLIDSIGNIDFAVEEARKLKLEMDIKSGSRNIF